MDIYEFLYKDDIGNCAPGDVIKFAWVDEGDPYIEQVHIIDVDFREDQAVVTGFSDVSGDKAEFWLPEDLEVEVYGG